MADNDPIRVARNNIETSNPGTGTILERARNSPRTDAVLTVVSRNATDGIYGEASFNTNGVTGRSPNGFGMLGSSTNSAGVGGFSTSSNAVQGVSRSGNGVHGFSDDDGGVQGVSTNSNGVYGIGGGFGDGVLGSAINGVGVRGFSNDDGVQGSSRDGNGMRGFSRNGFGVGGHSRNSYGVSGTSLTNFGGFFSGPRSTNGSSGGLYVSGNLVKVDGEYSEALPHPDGSRRLMYASLSPESWYEDFGRGELVEGRGRVALDPDFAAILGIDDGDYHVFLTPEGDSNGLYVSSRNASAFEVREQQEGSSSISFSYRIVAVNKRRDGQPERLATVAKVEEPESIDFDRQEEEHRAQIDKSRRLAEEQRREMEELRRRVGPQEEAPPESA
jgi:hypothetical protein